MPLALGLPHLNFPAVFVAGLAHMATCLIWFSPPVFGNTWARLTGQYAKPGARWLAAGFVGHQAIALVLAVIMGFANATTVTGGLAIGAMAWAGFVVTLELGELIWERIPVKLFALRLGNHLVALCIAGAILAVWR